MGPMEDQGEICLKYNCNACCKDTKMPLTQRDIDNICGLGYNVGEFNIQSMGEKVLRTVHGECFFLFEGKCRIYEYRPEGCRVYPLIFDVELGKAIIDADCPHHDQFQESPEDIKKLKKIIKTIQKENT